MIEYHHVDVFADRPYTGSSVAVFVDPPALSGEQMLAITRELRHFESIFVRVAPGSRRGLARVFDLEGELDFAGHSVLGAAAVLQSAVPSGSVSAATWRFDLPGRTVQVRARRRADGLMSTMLDPGRPESVRMLDECHRGPVAAAIGLTQSDLAPDLPLAVVSAGLRYLIVPIRAGLLDRARMARLDFVEFLATLQAQFVYVLDADALEGRHWSNDGRTEDAATGSAAVCVAAFLRQHGRIRQGELAYLAQGRFVGRPSRIAIRAWRRAHGISRVTLGGEVAFVAAGRLRQAPRPPASDAGLNLLSGVDFSWEGALVAADARRPCRAAGRPLAQSDSQARDPRRRTDRRGR